MPWPDLILELFQFLFERTVLVFPFLGQRSRTLVCLRAFPGVLPRPQYMVLWGLLYIWSLCDGLT